ncbi:MAG: thiosulfate oxidation carrier complex protein SoxZ [Gammaproteobacteria bacterium]|nr:thiosulfate oxidation carrier complex protein SoxZ [Gammaproteobacteria bacterium]MCW8910402.1 thiosulfate oxidation carrier complex protein SoxZ [Gammaproteobacteria bacterium]MCW9004256.1 thiosulfate oxidation carrier complex protein SoxZ [Gammaproteobacteria bacterium]MCW9056661.1 thiosulfate oxidation carrier complex protein SoxZ [Gammaproteobacteria bacterium]
MANSIKVRAKVKDDVTVVKTLINHVMETGLRKDKKTNKMIPAHFIQEVTCEHNGKNVLTAQWGISVSKNPYLSFKFKGAKAGDSLKVSWVDNKGKSDSIESKIK